MGTGCDSLLNMEMSAIDFKAMNVHATQSRFLNDLKTTCRYLSCTYEIGIQQCLCF